MTPAQASELERLPVDGLWRNASGAELRLTQSGAWLAGDYLSRLGVAKASRRYALAGVRHGRCLGFSVAWAPDSDSLTSWSGLLTLDARGRPVIDAMFLLVSASTVRADLGLAVRTPADPWEAFRTQAVRFERP